MEVLYKLTLQQFKHADYQCRTTAINLPIFTNLHYAIRYYKAIILCCNFYLQFDEYYTIVYFMFFKIPQRSRWLNN